MNAAMRKFICLACGYIYDEALGDPDGGLPAGTRFVARNNLTVGLGVFSLTLPGWHQGNHALPPGALDPARLDLTLPEGSLLRGRVSPPPEIELRPTAEFRHPVGTRPLAAPTRWVPGAFQGPDAMPPGRPAP